MIGMETIGAVVLVLLLVVLALDSVIIRDLERRVKQIEAKLNPTEQEEAHAN